MKTVSDLFVECLENEGVTTIFGVPGEENEDLLFSLDKSNIQFIPCRHEQGAAFMADVWGRLTGQAGVCLATLGPGATNLITGVADANLDKAPLVAITAQGGLSRLHHESHQYLDIVEMFQPISKWNTAISAPEIVTEVVRKAFKIAQYEKPGVSHIELSEDIAGQQVSPDMRPLAAKALPQAQPAAEAIDRTVAQLKAAHRPLILVGQGAIRASASQPLTDLAETCGIPVVSTFMG